MGSYTFGQSACLDAPLSYYQKKTPARMQGFVASRPREKTGTVRDMA
ncbi:MAG: hypothetical protein ACO3PR_00530 [Limisphaerales bacterium]